MKTIINSDGLFKQRIALIKYKYIQDFIPKKSSEDSFVGNLLRREKTEGEKQYLKWSKLINSVLNSSGFNILYLYTPLDKEVLEGKYKAGLKITPRFLSESLLKTIKYCPSCINEFIKLYGTAYLSSHWLYEESVCSKCNGTLAEFSPVDRKHTVDFLQHIFRGNSHEK